MRQESDVMDGNQDFMVEFTSGTHGLFKYGMLNACVQLLLDHSLSSCLLIKRRQTKVQAWDKQMPAYDSRMAK